MMAALLVGATVRCESAPACSALIAIEQRRHGVSKNRERETKNLRNAKPNVRPRLVAHLAIRRHNEERGVTAAESKGLKKGSRVYWRGDAADGGSVVEMSWGPTELATNEQFNLERIIREFRWHPF